MLDVLGKGPVIGSKSERMIGERFPGLLQFRADFSAEVEILDHCGEIEKTELRWVRL